MVKFYKIANQEMVAALTKGNDKYNPYPYSTMGAFLNVAGERYHLTMFKAPGQQMKFVVYHCKGNGMFMELVKVSEEEIGGERLSWKRFGKLAKEWYEYAQMKEAA